MKKFVSAGALFVLMIAMAWGQEKSVKPGINDQFKNPDVDGFLKKFEIESREVYNNRKEIVAKVQLQPGLVVADVGAGTGLFTRLFAKEVGEKGKVIAVDIAANFLNHIQKSSKEEGLNNVETLRCTADSSNLKENSVDVVFICDTYHHFEFPMKTMPSIHKALRKGGKLVLIDFIREEGVTSKKMMDHVRAGKEVFTKEIVDSGFKVVKEEKFLKENYFIVFEKK